MSEFNRNAATPQLLYPLARVDKRWIAVSARRIASRTGDDIGTQRGPNKSLIAFGYAGWAPGQLEGEFAHGFWYTTPQDANLVFDDDRDDVWDHAMKRRTQDL